MGINSFTVPSPLHQGTTATIKIQTKNFDPSSTTGSITLYRDGAVEKTWTNLSFPNGQINTQSYGFNTSGLAGKTIKWYAVVTVDDTDPLPSNNISAVKSIVVTK